MDYMNWYEKCLWLARLKSNGGELSEFERSELEKSIRYSIGNSNDGNDRNVDILPA